MTGFIKSYKSYVFRDKDPVIDRVRTAVEDSGQKYKSVSAGSGVSTTTLYSWFRGKTRRPQYATVMAVLRAVGKDLVIVDRSAVRRGSQRRAALRVVSGGKAR
jgi:DNA-binding phage protein